MDSQASLQDLVQCTCYVTRSRDIEAGMKAWNDADSGHCEVLYLVVNELPKGALVEWQGSAYIAAEPDSILREKDVVNVADVGVRIHTNFTRMDNLCTFSCSIGMLIIFSVKL